LVLVDDVCVSVNLTKVRRNLTRLVNLFQQKESKNITNTQTIASTLNTQANISISFNSTVSSSTNAMLSKTNTFDSNQNI
jgi:ACT domain-containing protein